MKSFYQYLLTYRGKTVADDESRLADWAFSEHDFPKHSDSYDEISEYLEFHSPFHDSLSVFDRLWELYILNEKRLGQ